MTKPTRYGRSPQSAVACLGLVALLTYADLASKAWATSALSSAPETPAGRACETTSDGVVYSQRGQLAPLILSEGYLEFRYAENCGAAFGMLHSSPAWLRLALFAPAALAAAFGLLWLYCTGYGGRLFAASTPLIASGAVGNLLDRFRFGYVVDFIRLHVHDSFVWPTFNIADVTITLGVALLFMEGFVSQRSSAVGATESRPAVPPSAPASADVPH